MQNRIMTWADLERLRGLIVELDETHDQLMELEQRCEMLRDQVFEKLSPGDKVALEDGREFVIIDLLDESAGLSQSLHVPGREVGRYGWAINPKAEG